MLESTLVSSIKKALITLGATVYKIHGGKFQESGIPDLIGVYNSYFFGVETKIGKNVVSDIQQYQITRLIKAGAKVFIVRETNYNEFLNNFIEYMLNKKEWKYD